ncbi:fumarate hydratase C-terminal domain-containing protein [bacterium]|nr:fumarate hydratase C-terminal domain-containing protein [bacterium]
MICADREIKAGNIVNLSGEMLTLRDASAKMLARMLENGENTGLDLDNSAVFFAAPTPGFEEGRMSIGPTTSSRMAAFIPLLVRHGVKYFIGKGGLPESALKAITDGNSCYFQAFGGTGANYGGKISDMKPMLFLELGPEAVYKVEAADFPVVISVDPNGGIFF